MAKPFSLILAQAVAGDDFSDICAKVSPEACLDSSDDSGAHVCAWLVLDGACAPASDASVLATDPNCCASAAEGSICALKAAADLAREGACRLPGTAGRRAATPSLATMTRNLHLAGAAYCIASNSWKCGYHCDPVTGISDVTAISGTNNLHGYVAYDAEQEVIVLAFRGTDSSTISNWVSNLDAFYTYPIAQFPDVAAHEGFWKAWQVLKSQAVSAITTLKNRYQTSVVLAVGHSLGGAMAENAALDLKLNNGLNTQVMTFGAPRTGNSVYHNVVKTSISYNWRITHNNDLVVHVPQQRLGFYHTATEIHFPNRGELTYKICDGSGEDPECANACSWIIGGVCTSVDDHLNYLGMDCCSCAASVSSNITVDVVV